MLNELFRGFELSEKAKVFYIPKEDKDENKELEIRIM
jgi:hypothetical protein